MTANRADDGGQLAERCLPRPAERRVAAALYVALADTRTPDAARRALSAFGTPQTRADATALLRIIRTEAEAAIL